MAVLWQDIRYGLRMLAKSRGFTMVALLSLGLGIGANTAIFSVINGVLLKSLPVRDPQDLRIVGWTSPDPAVGGLTSDMRGRTRSGEAFWMSFPYPGYRDFAERAEGFSSVFAFSFSEEGLTVSGGGAATLAAGLMVSGNFFEGYGAAVLIGRPIRPQDDRLGADPVAVIAYRFWRRHYDLDPHVLGQTLLVNDTACTIVGVLPQRFRGPLRGDPTDVYLPLTLTPRILSEDDDRLVRSDQWWVRVMGRLAPGATDAQAHASLDTLFHQMLSTAGIRMERPRIVVEEGRRGLGLSDEKGTLVLALLQALVGVVLLVACVNVAGLLLARGAARRHEICVRAALGAGRWRLIRQSLTESLVLSLGAAAVGLMLSVCIKAAIVGSAARLLRTQLDLGYMGDSSAGIHLAQGIDGRVLLFTLAVGLFTTLLFGLLPALRVSCVSPSAELKDNAGHGTPRLRLGKLMVAAQVGLSMMLVMAAVLLTRTVVKLHRVDPGFDTENLLVFHLTPLESTHATRELPRFFDTVRATIAAIPGVRSVALSSMEGSWFTEVSILGRTHEGPEIPMYIVSDGWFATMGIALLTGRDFSSGDVAGSPSAVIVNEALAHRLFQDEYPIGRLLKTERGECQIVGVCGNHKPDLRRDAAPLIYFYTGQERDRRMGFTVRSVLPPLSLVPAVRRAVAQIDPGLPLEEVTTRELQLKESIFLERALAALCVSLALLALGLCSIGVYGLMAYSVARRTGEIGIRMALGARPADVSRPILCEAGLLAIAGVVMGTPLTLVLALILGSIVFHFVLCDPVTLSVSGLILLVVTIAAAWLPARRAARVDPMVALRYE
jgi:predicted permease